MNANEVKSVIDVLNYIEGCLRDFEGGTSTLEETKSSLFELFVIIMEECIELNKNKLNETNNNKRRT